MVLKKSTNRSPGTQRTPKGITQGNILVNPITGDPICVKEDEEGNYRLCVDTTVTLDGTTIDVDLDASTDSVAIGNPNNSFTLLINDDGSINTNVVVDSKDGDNIAISAHPASNQITSKSANTLTTAAAKTIFTYTSASDNTRIRRIKCTAATPCTFTLKINGTTEEVLRSSPVERNITFVFDEHLAVTNTQVVTIEAQAERFFTNNSPYSTFTKLEGYLCS